MSRLGTKKIHMSGVKRGALDQAQGRLVLIGVFFALAYIVVAARATDLCLIQGELQKPSEENVFESKIINKEPLKERADILDRNGVILARSLKTASLYADPKIVTDPAKLAKDLKKIFPSLTYGSVLKKLQSKKRFVWIKRNINPIEQSKILMLGAPALNFEEEMKRIYPQGSLAVHMVGASGVDGQGLSGIEQSFDHLLASQKAPLKLSLDVRLQHVLKKEISSVIKKHKAKAGNGVVMDVQTGEILAAVSLPDYDPHHYNKAKDNQKFNRLSLGVYELGSSFKIFSTAALLEKTNGRMTQKFDVREPIEIGRYKIRDYHPEKRVLSLPEVFIHSSNIGSAMMGQNVGTNKLKSFYKDLGFLDPLEFELSEIGAPIVPKPWGAVHTLTTSYGHGIAVSPLQLTSAAAAMVNGGVLVKPTLIASDSALTTKEKKNKSALQIISPETSHRMRQLLRLNVTEGTGSKADVNGFMVGGKTGTAEKPGRGGYNEKKLISSFLGAFPMNDPRYLVFVMVDEPKGIKETYGYATGGWVGAPVVGKVISGMASVLSLKPAAAKEEGFERGLLKYIKTKEQIKREREIAAH